MQIQRIQTLMLLIAVILVAVFCFVPYGTVAAEPQAVSVFVTDAPALLVLNIAIAVLLFITIFMYRDLRLQMRLTILSLLLICSSAVTALFILSRAYDNATPILLGGIGLLVLALIFGLLAYRGMRRDKRLLASADRIR